MYSKDERTKIKEAWIHFMETGHIDENGGVVRKEIAESWTRCKKHGVAFHETETPSVNPKEFNKIYESKKELLAAAEPYIRNLYEMIAGSNSYICITDENAMVLSSFYDENMVDFSAETFTLPGRIISEESTGTNAIGTSLYLGKPFCVFGEEHYKISSHVVSCFTAPIRGKDQKIIGLINISGFCEDMDIKGLALITSTAGAIEREIRLRDAYRDISLNNALLQTTLNSISDGALLLDDKNCVIHANNNALRILETSESNILYKNMNEVIPKSVPWEHLFSERKTVEDREIRFTKNNKLLHLVASIYPCENSANIVSHKVVILKEMKDVKKLINKMTGSSANYTFQSIVHKSEIMGNVIELAKRAARSDSTVLLRGESGTGKEMFAQAIHNASDRKDCPFIAINCGALPRGLVESELFGYEGGTFTGSRKEGHLGKFELAEGGTIFFDEIGDMPLDLQTTLLRVLQNKEVTRIGGTTSKQVNVRIIAATNCDLEAMIQSRAFREDLYYRLNVFPIVIPPLRQRPEDIDELAYHLAKKYCIHFGVEFSGFSQEAANIIRNYPWPGNVRELENVIERAVNINTGPILDTAALPPNLAKVNKEDSSYPLKRAAVEYFSSDANSEQGRLMSALAYTRGNVKDAAEILNVSYRSIYRRLEKYNIDKSIFRTPPSHRL